MNERIPINPIKAPAGSSPELVEVVRQLNGELAKIRAEVPKRVGNVVPDSGLALDTSHFFEVRQDNQIIKLGIVS